MAELRGGAHISSQLNRWHVGSGLYEKSFRESLARMVKVMTILLAVEQFAVLDKNVATVIKRDKFRAVSSLIKYASAMQPMLKAVTHDTLAAKVAFRSEALCRLSIPFYNEEL